MKRYTFPIAFLMSLLGATPARGETVTHTLNLPIEELSITTTTTHDGYTFTEIELPETEQLMEMDEPMLPVKYFNVRVPENSKGHTAKVKSGKFRQGYTLTHPIKPYKTCTTNENPDDISYAELTGVGYGTKFGRPSAEVVSEFFLNGCEHYITFAVYPVSYLGRTNTLTTWSDLVVELSYDECAATEMKFRPLKSAGFTRMYDSDILDYYITDTGTKKLASAPKKSSAVDEYAESMDQSKVYVILVPENLRESVDELADWKRQLGFSVTIETPEAILKNSSFAIGANEYCVDAAASVREWLRAMYSSVGAFHCLMIGDWLTSMPIRKYGNSYNHNEKQEVINRANPHDNFYDPSDYYFTDLVSTWEYTKEGDFYYIERPKVNERSYSSPTIAVGRLLCSEAEEVVRYTKKLKLYELYPGKGNSEYLGRGYQLMENYFSTIKSIFTGLSIVPEVEIANHAKRIEDLKPDPQDVLDKMNNVGIMSIFVHGGPIGFQVAELDTIGPESTKWPPGKTLMAQTEYHNLHSRYQFNGVRGLDRLSNFSSPSVLYSGSCSVAPFDSLVIRKKNNGKITDISEVQKYNMASAYTVAGDYGGVLALMNTRIGWYPISGYLEQNFGTALEKYRWATAGILENASKIMPIFSPYTREIRDVNLRHSVIGDPSIIIWRDALNYLSYNVARRPQGYAISMPNAPSGYYTVSCGSYTKRQPFSNAKGFLIDLDNKFSNNSYPRLIIVTIYSENHYPEVLFLDNVNGVGHTPCSVSSRQISLGEATSTSYKPVLVLDSKTTLNLDSYETIISDGGIDVSNEGELTLKTEKKVELQNDHIGSKGTLTVKASEITLNPGFTVDKGGQLYINAR
ncbi:MAG: hypothetical protein HDS24_03870 [Bacteroides sp.]|nr:hypothetical protein [Bacteroides sp.]